jgi:hypothetical protein
MKIYPSIGFGGIINASTIDSPGTLTIKTAGTTAVTINTSQNVGIGTTSPPAGTKLNVVASSVAAGADEHAGKFDFTANAATTTFGQVGVYGTVSIGSSYVGTGGINGARGAITIAGAGTTIGTMTGVLGGFNTTANSTVTLAACFRTSLSNSGTSVFTTVSGFHAGDHSVAGTTVSGFFGGLTAGANKWNLYMSGTANNYIAGSLGIGTNAPGATAILDVQSTTKGVRFPNMSTAQKNAITPGAGTVIFDSGLSKLCVYSGAGWETITSV